MFIPKIRYEHIVLNDEYITRLRNKTWEPSGAYMCPQTREIVICRYSVDENANLSPAERAHMTMACRLLEEKETELVAHESKHMDNWIVDWRRVIRTYYEYLALHMLDELSALAAGFTHLYTHPGPEQMGPALRDATKYYMGCNYIGTYMNEITPAINRSIQNGDARLVKLENWAHEHHRSSLYSPQFQDAVRLFFTFGNTCIFDKPYFSQLSKMDEWREFKSDLIKIRRGHFDTLHRVIDKKTAHIR